MNHGISLGLAITIVLVAAGITTGHVAWFIGALVVLVVGEIIG